MLARSLRCRYSTSKYTPALINSDLTVGPWLIKGIDVAGNRYEGSTLVFETQVAQGQDFNLTGHFNWISSGGQFGRENFTGTLLSDRNIQLSGFEIVRPAFGIVLGNYFAIFAESGTELTNGSWNGLGGAIPSNNWSAALATVPLPAAALLFVPGLLGLGVLANRRHS